MKQPPRCIQGSAKAWAGPAMLFSPAQMAWPRGSGQRQDGRTAGRQDGRRCPRGTGGSQLLSCSHRPGGSSTCGELRPHLEISITWLLFSHPDIHSSQPLTLPLCPRCVQDSRVLCYPLPSVVAPRHGTAEGAPQPAAQEGRKPLTHCPLPSWERLSEP